MPVQSVVSQLGGSIETGEITDGAVTYAKLATSTKNALPPIGVISAWLKSYTNTPTLPGDWVECNGQTLSDAASPYNGQVIPNLNGNNNFLRGSSTSGTTGGSATHSHTVGLTDAGGQAGGGLAQATTYTTSASNNEPPYYEVVWVMRIK